MSTVDQRQEAVVIGGGFYGAAIAIYLAKQRDFKNITLIEREPGLFKRASYNNQARVHNGYHYPRSFTTAYRSRVNFPKFIRDWSSALKCDFTKLYGITRHHSKVTAKQFMRFCHEIDANIEPVSADLRTLFEPRLFDNIFMAEEHVFDSLKLASLVEKELIDCGVKLLFNSQATGILKGGNNLLLVAALLDQEVEQLISCRFVFNCTYSGLNQLTGDFPGIQTGLKQEITEMALLKMPAELENLGITIMDGSFFSMMPFPARGMHTLSHVRYTPHLYWEDKRGIDPYQKLEKYERTSRINRMVRDVSRYIPIIEKARYIESLFEVKTVLIKNEVDDGRPILFEKYPELPGCYSVLGGKIDNIYDVLEKLNEEIL